MRHTLFIIFLSFPFFFFFWPTRTNNCLCLQSIKQITVVNERSSHRGDGIRPLFVVFARHIFLLYSSAAETAVFDLRRFEDLPTILYTSVVVVVTYRRGCGCRSGRRRPTASGSTKLSIPLMRLFYTLRLAP